MLMPSSYGLSCVGAAMDDDPCFVGHKNVRGSGIDVTINECMNIRSNACCIIAINASVKKENNCSALQQKKEFYDNCLYLVAFKNHDPSYCENISDPNIKSGCLISTKALQQDPTICTGCAEPVESIEDLR